MRYNEKYRTVVFKITDRDKFQPFYSLICDAMGEKKDIEGAQVTGLSASEALGDISKLEEYAEYLQNLLDGEYMTYELFDDWLKENED